MAYIHWIPYRFQKKIELTIFGDIPVAAWKDWSKTNPCTLNPFIATNELLPSRFAMAYSPPTELDVYIDIVFIPLDAENLCEDREDYYDFGDNQSLYFKGNKNKILEEITEDDHSEDEQTLDIHADLSEIYKFIPKNVVHFLKTPIHEL